jgi:CMP-N-acetylneuraminic acid synthetase
MINDKTVLVVVTARAGSVGVPGKNYRDFCNEPLVNWSIEAAKYSDHVDKIAVSSNCPDVHKAVKCYLDEPHCYWAKRPDILSTGSSKNEAALIHSYYAMLLNYNFDADIIVNLQPTSPIRTNNLIDRCLESFAKSENADSLLTVNKETPFFWQKKDGKVTSTYDPKNRPMRQEISDDEFIFHDNGNVYLMTKDCLLNGGCRIGKSPVLFETDEHQSLQIDTENDFKILEFICKECYNNMPTTVRSKR